MTHSKPRLYPCLINHVILRSLDGQSLFNEEADREYFLDCLRDSIRSHDLCIYAYGLMEEHIHLLFKTPLDPSKALCCIKKMRIVSAGDSLHIWRQRNGFLHAAIAHDLVVESLAQRRRTDD